MIATEHLESFMQSIECSSTRRAYKKHICDYLNDCTSVPLEEAFGRNYAGVQFKRLQASADKASTKNQRLAALRSFGRFLLHREVLPENGFSLFPYFKSDSDQQKQGFLTLDDLRRCIQHLHAQQGELSFRDTLMFKLIYSSGLKVSELIHLTLEDVDLPQAIVRIGDRAVPIYPDLIDSIREYIRDHRTKNKTDSNFLFLSSDGQPLSRSTVFRRIQKVGVSVGIPLSPSLLRNSFAAIAFGQGVDLSVLREVLGHKSIQTTSRMIQRDRSRVTKNHRRFQSQRQMSV